MPDRLHRLQQSFGSHPIYFVTTCTYLRRPILTHPAVNDRLKQFSQAGPEHGAWLGAYVLMPDHLHAFVAFDEPDPGRLSKWMRLLKNALAKELNGLGHTAPHWQKGFFDHLLRNGKSYSEKWLYVWNNPVRAGLVKRAEDWEFFGQPFPLMMH